MAYVHNQQHRSSAFAATKSQWLIAIQEEEACYQQAAAKNWLCNGCYWGLHLTGSIPSVIGLAPLPAAIQLHIAKFVGVPQGDWHGYPVAPWLSPFDKPSASVLGAWMQSGFINRPTIAKIHRGKRCVL
jgi:hypothetical protein